MKPWTTLIVLVASTLVCIEVVADPPEACKLGPKAQCAGADLYDLCRENIDLSRADFSGANLERAHLNGANLDMADLRRADLRGAHLDKAIMNTARLDGAIFDHATHWPLNFMATTRGALFRPELSQPSSEIVTANPPYTGPIHGPGVDLSRLDLSGGHFFDTDLQRANFKWANLEKASMSRANLHGANLMNTNMRHARLLGAIMTRANCQMADLRGALLIGADLRGADLRYSKLAEAHLHKALYDDETQWPKDFNPSTHGAIYIHD